MTEALNVQDDMAREANSGAASVPQAFSGKVAFASSETQSAGGSQPPIDLKRRTFSADWAGNGDVGELQAAAQVFPNYAHYNRRPVRLAFPRNVSAPYAKIGKPKRRATITPK